MMGHPKEMLLVALAGPVCNILQAVLWMTLDHYWVECAWARPWWCVDLMYHGVQMNLAYAMIHLVPIPPMDAHHLLDWLLPRRFTAMYRRLGNWGLLVMAILVFSGRLSVIGSTLVPILTDWLHFFLKQWIWS